MDSFLRLTAKDLYNRYGDHLPDVAVIFPNNRAKLFFGDCLYRIAGKPVWTPSFLTINDLFSSHSQLKTADSFTLVAMEGLRLNRTQLSILDAKIGSIRTETINVINTNSKPVRISFRKVPSYLRIVTSDAILRPKGTATITVSYLASQAKDYGRKEDSFYIVLNNNIKNFTNNKINVSAYITEDFSKLSPGQLQNAPAGIYSENRINFGKMAKKERKVQYITLTNTGKSPLFIRKIVPEYQGLKVTPDRNVLQTGKTMRIKLDFNVGNFSGNIVQRVTIFTNDPRNSISRLFATAQVD